MKTYDTIIAELTDNVGIVRLNRPDVLNAVTPEVFQELFDAIETLRREGARALLLTGEGRGFCSGANLAGRDLNSGSPGSGARYGLQTAYNPGMNAIYSLDIPVVCAVNGPAAGIGCTLALAGDIVIAGRSAFFLQAFANIGLVPDGGSTWLLPRILGLPRAMEMMLLGERVPAEKAAEWGLINRCVDDDNLMDEAMAVAKRLANGPTVALGMIRKMVREAQLKSYAEAANLEAEAQKIAGDTEDFREGVTAFQEKRKAQFQGR